MSALLTPLRRFGMMSRDKADTMLLLFSVLLVLLPHTLHLPGWVSALCLLILLWRAVITLGGRRMPPSVLVLPLAAVAMAGVMLSFHTFLGKDPGVAMLVLLVAFKTLEMHARRDLFIVVFLCFFVALTTFFYSQSIFTGLASAVAVLSLLTTLLSFQYAGTVPPLRRRVRRAAAILALAAPLALCIFVAFPRVQGPLWGLPDDGHSGRTGLSEDMSPGNFSNLAQSEAVVFRAQFSGPPPEQAQLYWRAIVLGAFDGRTWTRGADARPGGATVLVRGPARHYEVTLEPLGTHWLYALEMPVRPPTLGAFEASVTRAVEMASPLPVEQRLRYQMDAHTAYALDGGAVLADAPRWLHLPGTANPRTRAAGAALAASGPPVARVNAVLQRFRHEPFVYTLEPPLLGADPVDQFLFDTRSGFCEHFSSAFVVLMRAAGVPARVVTGYQGGEANPVDGFLTVRQSDAHAWAEVWLGQRGWVRVDPTAAVAPDRIRRSLAQALPPRPPFGIEGLSGLMAYSNDASTWLGQLRFQMGALNNGWNQWVLNYTPTRQRELVGSLTLGLFNWRSMGLLAVSLGLLWGAHALRQRRRNDPVDALYSALCQRLAQLGYARAPHEGPTAFAARIDAARIGPARHQAALAFLRYYSAYRYGPAAPAPGLVATLKNLLAQCR